MSRSTKPRRAAAKSGRTQGHGPFRGPWPFLLGLLVLVIAGFVEGPVVVRQVSSLLGLQRVESHAELLREVGRESGLDPCLLAGVMYVESRGRVDAVSSAGALGLFQLMPPAASDAARRLRLPPPTRAELLTDARLNARLGANHLRQLFRSLGPEPERVLVAYNAGRGRLLEWERAAGGWAAWRAARARGNDSPTLAYAQDVLAFAQRFRERGVVSGAPATSPASAGLSAEVRLGPAPEVEDPVDGDEETGPAPPGEGAAPPRAPAPDRSPTPPPGARPENPSRLPDDSLKQS